MNKIELARDLIATNKLLEKLGIKYVAMSMRGETAVFVWEQTFPKTTKRYVVEVSPDELPNEIPEKIPEKYLAKLPNYESEKNSDIYTLIRLLGNAGVELVGIEGAEINNGPGTVWTFRGKNKYGEKVEFKVCSTRYGITH